MVMYAHIKKYVEGNPQLFSDTALSILERAQLLSAPGGTEPIGNGQVRGLLGKYTEGFLHLIGTDRDYMEISAQAASAHQHTEN